MDALRRADADVATATHPGRNLRWRLNRFNPKWRFNMDKNRIAHPLQYEKRKGRNKLNYINPLFYIRRIKNNLMSVGHRNHI
ncbi:hypothetical protein BDL97_18G060700 [Sphagnum fallax]|uniref:Uncharacterized protein n=1 Tax=Sphagnum jensenii TaxID=128206 RepID=A0ABP0WKJ8_9BRYO|nr:hypothetical protein BDL97_18G060700 [Sphagnum fallax]